MIPDSRPQRRHTRRGLASEAFILMAMTLVSVAAGLGLYLQLGLGLWGAGLTALAIYLGLIGAHAVVRRTEAIRELSYEVDRLEGEVMRIARGTGPMLPMRPDQPPQFRPGPTPASFGEAHAVRPQPAVGLGPAGVAWPVPGTESARRSPGAHPGPASGTRAPAASAELNSEQESTARPAGGAAGSGVAVPGLEPAAPHPVERTGVGPADLEQHAPTLAAGTQSGDPMARFWSARPNDAKADLPRRSVGNPGAPSLQEGAAVPTPAGSVEQPPQRAEPPRAAAGSDGELSEAAGAVEGDVDVINGMIRKYGREIGVPNAGSQPAAAPPPDGGAAGPELHSRGEADIAASVEALRAAASEMRRPGEGGPTSIERGVLPPLRIDPGSKAPQPPPVGPRHGQIASVAEAIATQKLDVYLEPILGLADRKARHYEISLRLRSGGASIGPEQYMPMARSSGMLPLLDATRAARASMVARHLDERGGAGCLFASISAESLSGERFLGEFSEVCRHSPRLRERLVFSIAQHELRGLSAPQWAALRQLAEAGFRFAIADVTSLDLDLPELRSMGFTFMRVAARSLLDGVSGLDGAISAADLSRRVDGSGLTLIAIGLEAEDQLDGVLSAGVPLGQGPLFGLPRPVKAEALRPASAAA